MKMAFIEWEEVYAGTSTARSKKKINASGQWKSVIFDVESPKEDLPKESYFGDQALKP